MSSQKGNVAKSGAPAHQNRTAFHHNKNSKLTKKIVSLPNEGLCAKCHAIIEWKKKYRKYKPLTVARKCQVCNQKAITHAYHVICQGCAKVQECCAKCREKKEIVQKFVTEEDKQRKENQFKDFMDRLSERQRRSFMRKLDRGEISEEDFVQQLQKRAQDATDSDDLDDLEGLDLSDDEDGDEDEDDEQEGENEKKKAPEKRSATLQPKSTDPTKPSAPTVPAMPGAAKAGPVAKAKKPVESQAQAGKQAESEDDEDEDEDEDDDEDAADDEDEEDD